jgi:hypothetical protein
MRTILMKLVLLMGVIPITALTQEATFQDTLLDHLVGKWVLKGVIDGKETTHDIAADWVLGHQYIQMNEVSREKDKNGKPEYSAIVYLCWEQKIKQYSCLWLDNTGNGGLSAAAIGHAKPNGDKIELVFKSSDGSLFHTTFSYDRLTRTWQWGMDGEEDGKLQPFARVKLTKK